MAGGGGWRRAAGCSPRTRSSMIEVGRRALRVRARTQSKAPKPVESTLQGRNKVYILTARQGKFGLCARVLAFSERRRAIFFQSRRPGRRGVEEFPNKEPVGYRFEFLDRGLSATRGFLVRSIDGLTTNIDRSIGRSNQQNDRSSRSIDRLSVRRSVGRVDRHVSGAD